MGAPTTDGFGFDAVHGEDRPATSSGHGRAGDGDARLVLKAVLDRIVAALLLTLTLVWLVLISAVLWLAEPGPVLSREPKLGRHGREFQLLRFRSTVLCLGSGAGPSPDGAGVARFRAVTRIGRILQRSCLDELPQLINVLRGDMSLVGPRPQDPGASSDKARALPARPGLVGLDGRGSRRGGPGSRPTDVDDYIRNYSVGLDLAILWRALRSGLSSDDAG